MCVCVCVHIQQCKSPIVAAAAQVWSQWGVRGWRRSFKQMWCSLSFFSWGFFPIRFFAALSWHDMICDDAGREMGMTETAWGGGCDGDREAKGDWWRLWIDSSAGTSTTWLMDYTAPNIRSISPIIQSFFPFRLWEKGNPLLNKKSVIIKQLIPAGGAVSNMFRDTCSHDNSFLNRWVNENCFCRAEEENPPFKLSRCHVNPLGGLKRERTACGESKNKRAAGSSGG